MWKWVSVTYGGNQACRRHFFAGQSGFSACGIVWDNRGSRYAAKESVEGILGARLPDCKNCGGTHAARGSKR